MSDVFVRDDQIADVKFYVNGRKDSIKIISPDSYSQLRAFEKRDYEECHVFLKPLTWGKSCQLQSAACIINPETYTRVFDSDRYVQLKLSAIISDWSFKVKNIKGEDIPVMVTEENIDALHPVIANFILHSYNERFEVTEESRKNF